MRKFHKDATLVNQNVRKTNTPKVANMTVFQISMRNNLIDALQDLVNPKMTTSVTKKVDFRE